ncbi:MAG TPA: cyanophycinase, partial [Planctomycetota bacterium]|nr:cyanophycinase [Planctomycetota bacterium]
AGGDDPPAPFAQLLTRLGATAVRVFHASEPKRVDQAPNLDFLRTASGVWFDGGRQWRLVDVFAGTAALPLFEAVLARGGVIGGTSAGASIQSEFMVRGNPLGNAEEACEGYERGFGFLPGCAIDQHFLVRHRQQDLAGLIARYPQLIGLGIDESTAAVVQGSTLEVLGASKCALFDVRTATAAAQQQPEPMLLAPGERWDLVAGRKL